MITVHVLVDQYIHHWDGSSGELWYCIRPHVGTVADFEAWAGDPDTLIDGAGPRFDFVFPTVDQPCPAQLFAINLPASIDVWHGLSKKSPATPEWTRYARSSACKDATGTPYSAAFNRTFADHIKTELKENVLSSIEQHFYSGGEFEETKFQDRFATSGGQPLPVFRPITGTPVTSMFWLLGLMHRIGGQTALDDLKALAGYDLALVDSASTTGNPSSPPTSGRLASLHLPDGLPGKAEDAERAYFSDWLPALPKAAFPPEIGPDVAVTLPPVLYCKPPRHNLTFERTAEGAAIFRAPTAADGSNAAATRASAVVPTKLVAMEIEVVRSEVGDAFARVDLQLGLRLTGRLQPYRRTPVPLAPATIADPAHDASRLATMVEFQPDENCAGALMRFLADTPAADVDSLLKASFGSAIVGEQPDAGSAWTLEFVGAQAFAWEESKPRVRLLATPSAKAPPAVAGKPRGLARATAKLSIPTGPKVSMTPVANFVDEDKLTHTIGFWAEPAKPISASFNAAWVDAVDPTASRATIETNKTRITQVFQDDYDFERAQHATLIEGSVSITTATESKVVSAAQAAGVANPAGLNPYMNYAEGFGDFNVLRQTQTQPDGTIRQFDWNAQGATAAPGCNGELLGLTQPMPFLQRWSETPRDTKPGSKDVVQANWKNVRDHVAELYRVGNAAPKRSIGLALRHTFGTRLEVGALSPTLPLEWPVDLPTAAETRAQGKSTAVRDGHPFVRVDYADLASNRCTVTFDPTVLVFASPPDPTDHVSPEARAAAEQAFASGMQAWRALGELCDPRGNVSVALQPVAYNLFHKGPAGREIAADWQSALRDLDPVEAANAAFVADLRAWARDCFASKVEADLKPFSRPLTFSGTGLASVASIGRFDWTTTRSDDRDTHVRAGPKDGTGVDLVYVTERVDSNDALHSAIHNAAVSTPDIVASARRLAETLEGAWRASQTSSVPDGPAHAWSARRQSTKDSVTPEDPSSGAGDPMRPFEDVMQSLRDGTDWFPIPGAPDYSKLTVTPTLIPCGFCPVAPHPDLGGDTERLLETTLSTLQDYVDLALPIGVEQRTTGSADDWRLFFRQLEDASAAYSALINSLVTELLRAQPANDAGTTQAVATRSAAINGSMPATLRTTARDILMRQPALYRTMKSFLLSELSVSGPQATLSPLAGAQFTRWTKPWSDAADANAATSVHLDVSRLVTLDALPQSDEVTGSIAFIEPLEDSLYDNSFEVRPDAQRVEPFEAVIDTVAASQPGWMWKTQLPSTPIASEQTNASRRRVPLASRRPVAAPVAIGAFALPLDVGNIPPNATIKLSKLLAASSGLDAAGDYVVEAVLDPDTSQVRFESDVFRLIFAIQGDEEGDTTGSPTAFQNDLFTIETSAPDPTVTTASTQRSQASPAAESALSKEIRLLGAAIPGTADARLHIANIIPQLASIAKDYVKRPAPGIAPATGLQIQVTQAGTVKLVVMGATRPDRLRNAAVLKPKPGSPIADKAIRILVLDVMTDVWSDVGFALRQSRNAGVSLGGYRFDPYFLTSAVPVTPPSRHRPTKAVKNTPTDWEPGRLLKLPGRSISVKTLLDLVAQADVGTHKETLLTPGAAIKSGYRLIVSVWAEQFQRPQWNGKPLHPDGRHLPWTMAYVMTDDGLKGAPDVEFTQSARHFSIDLQWWTPSGESALRLERVFAIA